MVAAIANGRKLTQSQVEEVLEAFFDLIGLCLSTGEEVKLMNFGKFEARQRQPVQRRNPRTGEAVSVPAKTYVGFKPAPALRERVNT
jgi:nucleoid DNA-binding protein